MGGRLVLLFSILFFLFTMSMDDNYFHGGRSSMGDMIEGRLSRLGGLSSRAARGCVPCARLFPSTARGASLASRVGGAFSLFFQGFGCGVSSIVINAAGRSTAISIGLAAVSSGILTESFGTRLLQARVARSTRTRGKGVGSSSESLRTRCLVLGRLLGAGSCSATRASYGVRLIGANGSGGRG